LEDEKLKRMWTEEVSPNKKENYDKPQYSCGAWLKFEQGTY
jgi:hypothetical protein